MTDAENSFSVWFSSRNTVVTVRSSGLENICFFVKEVILRTRNKELVNKKN